MGVLAPVAHDAPPLSVTRRLTPSDNPSPSPPSHLYPLCHPSCCTQPSPHPSPQSRPGRRTDPPSRLAAASLPGTSAHGPSLWAPRRQRRPSASCLAGAPQPSRQSRSLDRARVGRGRTARSGATVRARLAHGPIRRRLECWIVRAPARQANGIARGAAGRADQGTWRCLECVPGAAQLIVLYIAAQ